MARALISLIPMLLISCQSPIDQPNEDVTESVALARHLCLLNSSRSESLLFTARAEGAIEVQAPIPSLEGGVVIGKGNTQDFINGTPYDGDAARIEATQVYQDCGDRAFERVEAAKRERRADRLSITGQITFQVSGLRRFASSREPVPSSSNVGAELEQPVRLACKSPSRFNVTWVTGERQQGGYCLVRPTTQGCEVSARWEGPNPGETQFSEWIPANAEKPTAKAEVATGGYYTSCTLQRIVN